MATKRPASLPVGQQRLSFKSFNGGDNKARPGGGPAGGSSGSTKKLRGNGGSAYTACPLCGAQVPLSLINHHMDSPGQCSGSSSAGGGGGPAQAPAPATAPAVAVAAAAGRRSGARGVAAELHRGNRAGSDAACVSAAAASSTIQVSADGRVQGRSLLAGGQAPDGCAAAAASGRHGGSGCSGAGAVVGSSSSRGTAGRSRQPPPGPPLAAVAAAGSVTIVAAGASTYNNADESITIMDDSDVEDDGVEVVSASSQEGDDNQPGVRDVGLRPSLEDSPAPPPHAVPLPPDAAAAAAPQHRTQPQQRKTPPSTSAADSVAAGAAALPAASPAADAPELAGQGNPQQPLLLQPQPPGAQPPPKQPPAGLPPLLLQPQPQVRAFFKARQARRCPGSSDGSGGGYGGAGAAAAAAAAAGGEVGDEESGGEEEAERAAATGGELCRPLLPPTPACDAPPTMRVVPHPRLQGQLLVLDFVSLEEEAALLELCDTPHPSQPPWLPPAWPDLTGGQAPGGQGQREAGAWGGAHALATVQRSRNKRWGVLPDYHRRGVAPATHPLPPLLLALARRMRAAVGGPLKDFHPNEANAIDYRRSHGSWLKPHADDRILSGEVIVNLSLAGDCVMTLARLQSGDGAPGGGGGGRGVGGGGGGGGAGDEYRVRLPRRSLQVLSKAARYSYSHGIWPADLFDERRVSITFRHSKPRPFAK